MLALLSDAVQAAAADGNINVLAWAIAQGPVGVLAAAIAYAWKQERARADKERDRADATQVKADALAREVMDRAIPELTKSTSAIAEVADLLRDIRRYGPTPGFQPGPGTAAGSNQPGAGDRV